MTEPRYKILEKIASGTYSDIHKIVDPDTNKLLALKSIKPEYSSFQVFHSIFRWNIEISKRISHPNIIKSHYFVHEIPHQYFLVMDLVDGYNLSELCTLLPELHHSIKFYILLEITRGLNACHKSHIIHRNIQPSNVLVGRDGKIFISNFGLAAVEKPDTGNIHIADNNVSFFAPEQINHIDVTDKADIWAFGIVMYELLLGKNPFSSNNPMVTIKKICDEQLNIPSDVDPSISVIIKKCTDKNPELRYPSISLIQENLENMLRLSGLSEKDCKEELIITLSDLTDDLVPGTSSKDHISNVILPKVPITKHTLSKPAISGDSVSKPRHHQDSSNSEIEEKDKNPAGPEYHFEEPDELSPEEFNQIDDIQKDPVIFENALEEEQPDGTQEVYKDHTESKAADSGITDKQNTGNIQVFQHEEMTDFNAKLAEAENVLNHKSENAEVTYTTQSVDFDNMFDPARPFPGKKSFVSGTDKLLLSILLILMGITIGLILIGDYFNVANWPVDLLNNDYKKTSFLSGSLFSPTPVVTETVEIISSFPKIPSIFQDTPTPTVKETIKIPAPDLSQVETPSATTQLTPIITPTFKPLQTVKADALSAFLSGNLQTSLSLFNQYAKSSPENRKEVLKYLEPVQSLLRSVANAKDDLKDERYSSALTQLIIIQEAYNSLAKKMDEKYIQKTALKIEGLDINETKEKISKFVLLLFLPDKKDVSKIYINSNPISFKSSEKSYLAKTLISKTSVFTLLIRNNEDQMKKIVLRSVDSDNKQQSRKSGVYIYNDHKTQFTISVNGKNQDLKPGHSVFLPSSKSISLYCGQWGNFEFGKDNLNSGEYRVTEIRVIHLD
ncbi:MAG: hypothetical protein A2161_01320 [Candidatus Schekmanbacteria bacterium RBG_13_48_7]|uniref:non-specific serine/threonine protein kinase n=1 Tax=Candidatus Schekmanbacteria bacterium RBG_13_48_7 TaxID=1817878 RepID=A0A1F7S7M5_9BACT|nr:MAG: hypothetical protein A2161_01320 [Candidatus Schekmanbacteria bacterium RBG_13_48_7]